MGGMRALHRKRNRFLYALAVSIAAWLVIIFTFSAQPSGESAQVSGGVCYRIAAGVNRVFHLGQSEAQIQETALRIEHPVRKGAHMSEYAVLSVMIFAMVGCLWWKIGARNYFLAVFFTFLYACTDEFHQRFVPGRSGSFGDVMIDTAGAALAMLFVFLLAVPVRRKIKKIEMEC